MATKPLEYRYYLLGFRTWRITYDIEIKRWILSYNLRMKGEQWHKVSPFELLESVTLAVAERKTGLSLWDDFGFWRGKAIRPQVLDDRCAGRRSGRRSGVAA